MICEFQFFFKVSFLPFKFSPQESGLEIHFCLEQNKVFLAVTHLLQLRLKKDTKDRRTQYWATGDGCGEANSSSPLQVWPHAPACSSTAPLLSQCLAWDTGSKQKKICGRQSCSCWRSLFYLSATVHEPSLLQDKI